MSKEYFDKGLDNEIVKAYQSYQIDFAVIFGAEKQKAEKNMNEVLLFEYELSKVSLK